MGGAMAVLAWRYLLEITTRKELFSRPVQRPRVVFVGSNEQKEELVNLFKNNGIQPAYFEHFNLDPVSNFDHLSALLEWHRINELILDTTSLSYTHIMELFQSVSKEVRIKTLGSDQSFLVGSESSFTQGSSLKSANYATSNTVYLRQKRILDQMVALTVVASLPIGIPLSLMTRRYRSWRTLLQKSHLLLIGKHTLVGYSPSLAKELGLPVLPEPIFNICTGIPHLLSQQQTCYALVKNYAKEADIQGDLTQLWRLSK
jgi:hypothetical protein